MENIAKAVYDNSKDGRPAFSIKTEDGKTLYANEYVSLDRGDRFVCDLSEKKTSERGNEYYNASNVRRLGDMEEPPVAPQTVTYDKPKLRVDASMFVTGVVTRAMGSGKFGVSDINTLTRAAVQAYQENFG